MRPEEWFSPEALRKQKRAREGDRSFANLVGYLEPRTQPSLEERCQNCMADARDKAGGSVRKHARWCSLCLGRGRDQDYEEPRVITLIERKDEEW